MDQMCKETIQMFISRGVDKKKLTWIHLKTAMLSEKSQEVEWLVHYDDLFTIKKKKIVLYLFADTYLQ